MKFTIKPAEDIAAFQAALKEARSVTSVSEIGVNKMAHIKADEKGLQITSTNHTLQITQTVSADVKTEGEAVIPAAMLANIVSTSDRASAVTVELKKKDNTAVVKFGESKFVLPTVDPSGYPVIDHLSKGEKVDIVEIADAFKRCLPAVKKDQSVALGTVLIDRQRNKNIAFVATDSYRLHSVNFPKDVLSENVLEETMAVPQEFAKEVIQMGSSDEECYISTKSSGDTTQKLSLKGETKTVTVKLFDSDSFPAYRNLLDQRDYDVAATFTSEQTQNLLFTLKQALLVGNGNDNVRLTFEDKGLLLECKGVGNEKMESKVSCEVTNPISLSVNPHYLIAGFSAVDGDVTVKTLQLDGGETKPFFVTDDEEKVVVLIMPIRVT